MITLSSCNLKSLDTLDISHSKIQQLIWNAHYVYFLLYSIMHANIVYVHSVTEISTDLNIYYGL